MKFRLALLGAVAACAAAASTPAFAVQRTFVASVGNDANPCSLALPCRGFAAAVAAVDAGGEVVVLDSAGYGPFTVAKSVSIIAPTGVYAGITVSAGDGVLVAAGANDKVVLRGLTVNGQGGSRGIVAGLGEVHVENCVVANMSQSGIEIGDTIDRAYIRDSVVRSNGGEGLRAWGRVYASGSHFADNAVGIRVLSTGSLVASRISVENNHGDGIVAVGMMPIPGAAGTSSSIATAVAIVSESVVSGNQGIGALAQPNGYAVRLEFIRSTIARNGGAGLFAGAFAPGAAFVVLTDSSLVDNQQDGVVAYGSGTTAVVTGSTVAGNGDLYADLKQQFDGVLRTSGTNTLTGRGAADVNGTLTPNPMR